MQPDIPPEAPKALPLPGAGGRFQAAPVRVRVEHILRIQGYTDLERVRRPIRRAANEAASMAEEVTRGEVAFARAAVKLGPDGALEVDGRRQLNCPAFSRYLADSGEAIIFVLTAGQAFDERIAELTRDERPVEAIIAHNTARRAIVVGPLIVVLFWALRGPEGAVAAAIGVAIVEWFQLDHATSYDTRFFTRPQRLRA